MMHTSPIQADRVLDPEDGNVTIETLQRAAAVVGRRVHPSLFDRRRTSLAPALPFPAAADLETSVRNSPARANWQEHEQERSLSLGGSIWQRFSLVQLSNFS